MISLPALGRPALVGAASILLSLSTHAAMVDYEGVVQDATGALVGVVPPGTAVLGSIDYDGSAVATGLVSPSDILDVDINVGNQCFTLGADTSGCTPGSAYVPITSIDAAAITFSGGVPTGGFLDVTTFSSLFGINIPINFDLTAGTFFADTGGFGIASGTFAPVAPIPVPAAAWLFSSSLLGLIAVKRRR